MVRTLLGKDYFPAVLLTILSGSGVVLLVGIATEQVPDSAHDDTVSSSGSRVGMVSRGVKSTISHGFESTGDAEHHTRRQLASLVLVYTRIRMKQHRVLSQEPASSA